MSRWIDADELIRYGKRGTLVYWEDIEVAPSIDIVRCGECKLGGTEDCPMDEIYSENFCSYGERKDEPQTYITEDRDTQILDAWQVYHRNTTSVEDEPQTERSNNELVE